MFPVVCLSVCYLCQTASKLLQNRSLSLNWRESFLLHHLGLSQQTTTCSFHYSICDTCHMAPHTHTRSDKLTGRTGYCFTCGYSSHLVLKCLVMQLGCEAISTGLSFFTFSLPLQLLQLTHLHMEEHMMLACKTHATHTQKLL